MKGYRCDFCQKWVSINQSMGTAHRNHCPNCLWSKHLDLEKPGDRKSGCRAAMEPIGLTFKQEGWDKYGKPKQGELMVVHRCLTCFKISINRIAADDEPKMILAVFKRSKILSPGIRKTLLDKKIQLLEEKDKKEVLAQLFGKSVVNQASA
jgi:hypothetical protein